MTLESLGLGPLETKLIPLLGTQHYLAISETMKYKFVSRRNPNCCVCSFGRGRKDLLQICIVQCKPHSLLVPIFKSWNFFASCTGLRVTLSAKSAESLKSFTFFCSAILKNPRDQCLITFEKKQTFYLAQGCQSPSGERPLLPSASSFHFRMQLPWILTFHLRKSTYGNILQQKKYIGCCTCNRKCSWPAPPSIQYASVL